MDKILANTRNLIFIISCFLLATNIVASSEALTSEIASEAETVLTTEDDLDTPVLSTETDTLLAQENPISLKDRMGQTLHYIHTHKCDILACSVLFIGFCFFLYIIANSPVREPREYTGSSSSYSDIPSVPRIRGIPRVLRRGHF